MNILFLHNNFPAQFKNLLPALVSLSHDVCFMSIEGHGVSIEGVRHFLVKPKDENTKLVKDNTKMLRKKLLVSELFRAALCQLKAKGFIPDIVVFHSGWGIGTHIRTVFPRAKLAAFAEWWFSWNSEDLLFEPNSDYSPSANLDTRIAERYVNLTQCFEISESNLVWTATNWQKQQFPNSIQSRLEVFHEGVDNSFFSPASSKHSSEFIHVTYTTRGLESIRAFEHFARIINILMSREPSIRLTIVGKDKPSYRPSPKGSLSLGKWSTQLFSDSGNIHRVNWIQDRLPLNKYRDLLQVSDLHFYFSRPFIASWSLLESMSCGCCIVASDVSLVREFLVDNTKQAGLLVDHKNHEKTAQDILQLIKDKTRMDEYRSTARAFALNYSKELMTSRALSFLGLS